MELGKLDTWKRMKLNHYLTPYTETNSKRIEDLNIRAKTIKLLGENISSKLLDSGLRDDVLDLILKVKATKAKTNKWDYDKAKSFRTMKGTINRMKEQPTLWEKNTCKSYAWQGINIQYIERIHTSE